MNSNSVSEIHLFLCNWWQLREKIRFEKAKLFVKQWWTLKNWNMVDSPEKFLTDWWRTKNGPDINKISSFLNKWWSIEENRRQKEELNKQKNRRYLETILFKNRFLDAFWEKRKHLREQQKKTTPNIDLFDILKIGTTEIRHSNFLAWLFNKEESHLHNTLFLEIFLSCARPLKKEQDNLLEIIKPEFKKYYEIRREFKDVDIAFVFDNSYIIIENKIKHTLQEHQPSKYENVALCECKKKEISKNRIFFILLMAIETDFDPANYNIDCQTFIVTYKTFFKKLKSHYNEIKSHYLKKIIKQYIGTLSTILIKGE